MGRLLRLGGMTKLARRAAVLTQMNWVQKMAQRVKT
jgi:hypothetical protein